jgi:hypothetical protein
MCRQAELQAKSLAHRERVERIKAARLAENIKAQRISDRYEQNICMYVYIYIKYIYI